MTLKIQCDTKRCAKRGKNDITASTRTESLRAGRTAERQTIYKDKCKRKPVSTVAEGDFGDLQTTQTKQKKPCSVSRSGIDRAKKSNRTYAQQNGRFFELAESVKKERAIE